MSEMTLFPARIGARNKGSIHRALVTLAIMVACIVVLAIVVYGFDYYWLNLAERPFSVKHSSLKPSGRVGIALGLLGFSLFLIIFLYPLRKRIPWLAKRGSTKNWLDFHIVAGTTAPIIIAFHASFKFQGIAGMAFWMMVAVALSGIAGRYIYAQIPRTLNSAEISLKVLEEMKSSLSHELSEARLFSAEDLKPLLDIPTAEQVRRMPALTAILSMTKVDFARRFHVAKLRSKVLYGQGRLRTLGGFRSSGNATIESAIDTAKRRAALSMRIAYLTKSQQVFHLWHVVHRPFSYAFAVLAVVHLVVVISLGFI
jgi:hypothetical protein